MKCLTVDQPYAHLLCGLDPGDPRQKRVENRIHDRFQNHRGLLLIHAGMTKRRLVFGGITGGGNGRQPELYGLDPKKLPLGAIIGAVDMASHFELGRMSAYFGHFEMEVNGVVTKSDSQQIVKKIIPAAELSVRPWLESHQHVEGPHCLVFENIRRFREPISCKGAQGLWNLPAGLVAKVKEQLEKAEVL